MTRLAAAGLLLCAMILSGCGLHPVRRCADHLLLCGAAAGATAVIVVDVP